MTTDPHDCWPDAAIEWNGWVLPPWFTSAASKRLSRRARWADRASDAWSLVAVALYGVSLMCGCPPPVVAVALALFLGHEASRLILKIVWRKDPLLVLDYYFGGLLEPRDSPRFYRMALVGHRAAVRRLLGSLILVTAATHATAGVVLVVVFVLKGGVT